MGSKKTFISGLTGGVVMFIVGNIFYYAFQGFYMTDAMTGLWKEMPMPGWIIQLFVVNLIAGILLAALYSKFGGVLSETSCKKGIVFGLWIGIVFALINGLTAWLLYPIPMSMHILGFIENIISFALMGAAIAVVYEKV